MRPLREKKSDVNYSDAMKAVSDIKPVRLGGSHIR